MTISYEKMPNLVVRDAYIFKKEVIFTNQSGKKKKKVKLRAIKF